MIQPSRRFELFIWALLPGFITVFLLLICLVPKHISGLSSFMPLLPLIPVFYWGILQAKEMPYWLVFAIGLVVDTVSGAPLGLTSLAYVFFLALLRAQHKYVHKEGFIIKWGYFAVLLLLIDCLDWLFMSVAAGSLQNPMPAFIQWLLTVSCYPVLHRLFYALQEHISARRWEILHGH